MERTEKLLDGRYRVIKILGRGSFGITYLAEDVWSDNMRCAIKKLDIQQADLATAQKLFQREVKILKLQQNHQIPKFMNYFEEGGSYYLVEEYIHGTPLNELINSPWQRQEVIQFLQQVLVVLNTLHQQNIIHRDIKPSNIIKREYDNQFVLIDFGAVKQLDPNFQSPEQPTQTKIITPEYAPLEQWAGKPSFNSDIYALGITAAQFLTGSHPSEFKRDDKDRLVLTEAIAPDDPLAAILVKMVHTHPERRYQSVTEVLQDLQKISAANSSVKVARTVGIKSGEKQPKFKQEKIYPYIVVGLTAFSTAIVGVEFFIHPFIRPLYYLYQGNSLLDRRQPEAALEQFENITESLKPNSANAWKGRGDALFSIGRYQAALASYEMANSYQPNDPKILVNKGKVLYKLGGDAYKQALDIYTKVLKINPNNVEAWSGKGLVHLGLNQSQQASESFEKVKQLRPNDPSIWQQIGLAIEQLKGGQAARPYFEEALSSYDDILTRKPKDIISWTDRGSVLLKLNRPQEALASYQKAIDIDFNFYEALMGKGNTLVLLGENNYLDALIAYNQASKIRPKDYQVWYNRGMLLSQHLKRQGEAIESFDKAIQLRDNFHPAWLGKGIALTEIARYQPALAAFDQAIKRQPQDPFIWANRGDTLTELKRYREARDSYQQAIDLGFPRAELETQLANARKLAAD